MKKPIIAVDLYCGIGGVTQGMLDAGAKVVLSIDGWDVAEYLHKVNYPSVPFVKRMLGEAPTEDLGLILKHLPADRDSYHFHLHGSPPCQAFSGLAGAKKRHISQGTKNVDHFLWLVKQLKPDSWSMENVPATRKHYPHLPHQMLAAKNHGVAQLRNRFFAGEGWRVPRAVWKNLVSWNSVIDDTGLPIGSVLNTVGCSVTTSPRSEASDSKWDCPSLTMTRQLPSIRKKQPDGSFVKIRSLTVMEMALLFGFPSTINLNTPSWFGAKDLTMAIGNSVCPPVMTALIESIISTTSTIDS